MDLGTMMMRVFGEVAGMVSIGVSGLQIAEEGVGGAKLLQLHAGPSAAGHDPLLGGSRGRDRLEAPRAIRHHADRGGQRRLRLVGNRFLGEFLLLQADPQWMSCLGRLHRRDWTFSAPYQSTNSGSRLQRDFILPLVELPPRIPRRPAQARPVAL